MFVAKRRFAREAELAKSDNGAKRRSIIMTVLATLNTRFEKFTLDNLLSEVARWMEAGCSIFQVELTELERANSPPVS